MASTLTAGVPRSPSPDRVQKGAPVAWAPKHELDPREWANAGRRIGEVGRCIQWLLGDWIAYGNAKFGERYALAGKITGYDTQTLMNMVYVASRFPVSRRREKLSWSHHETLASMTLDEQDRWLDQATTHRWSVADLRTMVRAARQGRIGEDDGSGSPGVAPARGVVPRTAKSNVVSCPRCGQAVSLDELGIA